MMYRSIDRCGRARRRGIVLLLVIAMLTLFSALALAFVFYAEAEGTASTLTSDTLNRTLPDADPELLASFFFSQLNYDTPNVYSALRGHSFARTMWGYNPYGANAAAYSGTGRIHYPYTAPPTLNPQFTTPPWPPLPPALTSLPPAQPLDDYSLINYTYFPTDGFIRDPEYYGYRQNTASYLNPANYRAGNASYTYQDMNSMLLALVNANGKVITNSFHRDYLPGVLAGVAPPPAPQLPASLKYVTLPVNPIYHNGFDNQNPPNPLLTNTGVPLGQFNATGVAAGDVQFDPNTGVIVGGHVRNLDFSPGYKISTRISAASNGQTLFAATPVVINVASTTWFPQSGVIAICNNGSTTLVTYTNKTPITFVGCKLAAGTLPLTTNQVIYPVPFLYTPNDSYWLDLGYPVMIAPNGQKYKALFAPLIIDLDNRLNLWLASASSSNRGYGPTEVSISNALGIPQPELNALNTLHFGGTPTGTPNVAEPNTFVWTLTPMLNAALGPFLGTFTITVGNPIIGTTVPIPRNATANVIQTALVGVVGPNNVAVVGGPINTSPVVITFAPNGQASIPITVNQANLRNGIINTLPWQLPLGSGPVYARTDADGKNGGPMRLPNPSFTGTFVTVAGGKPLPHKKINVNSTAGFPKAGTIAIFITSPPSPTAGITFVNYTGITATAFTGCSGGSGILAAGNIVTASLYAFPDYPDGRPFVTYTGQPGYNPTPVWYSNPVAGQTLAAELQANPLGYNIFMKMGRNNVPLPASHMEALLRPSGPSTPASIFAQLMPTTFYRNQATGALNNNGRNPNLVTSVSWSLDRITGAPYISYDPTLTANYLYPNNTNNPNGTTAYPTFATMPVPPAKPPGTVLTSPSIVGAPLQGMPQGYTAANNSEFAPPAGSLQPTEFRSNLVNQLRVNLNRLSKGIPLITGARERPRCCNISTIIRQPPTGTST